MEVVATRTVVEAPVHKEGWELALAAEVVEAVRRDEAGRPARERLAALSAEVDGANKLVGDMVAVVGETERSTKAMAAKSAEAKAALSHKIAEYNGLRSASKEAK